ncbi:MAG: helix-turn-helix transcriptional regulator [Chitinophagaceae bacterium]|nr:helix-turn-helix transcriptional regulator [Chitinophagaceae bacterium]
MEISRFPNNLRSYRHCQGYSQKKVARMLGLSDTSTLSRWETGAVMPRMVQIFRLARLYQVLPHQLYDDLWLHSATEDRLLAQDTEPFIPHHSPYA